MAELSGPAPGDAGDISEATAGHFLFFHILFFVCMVRICKEQKYRKSCAARSFARCLRVLLDLWQRNCTA
jgi:hypothetical protein